MECLILGHPNARSQSATAASSDKPEVLVPRHWTLYFGDVDTAVMEMHMSHRPCLVSVCDSNLWQLASRIVKKTWFDETQWRLEVINVHQVENPVLYRRYLTRRKEIRLTTGAGRSPIIPLSRLAGSKDVLTSTLGNILLLIVNRKVLPVSVHLHDDL
jgi:hypothetical protein